MSRVNSARLARMFAELTEHLGVKASDDALRAAIAADPWVAKWPIAAAITADAAPMAMAIIALVSDGPRIATSTSASKSDGKARMISITRMMIVSTHLGANPAKSPIRIPTKAATDTTITPTNSENRATADLGRLLGFFLSIIY